MKQAALVLGGAMLGGLAGYVGFAWLIRQGYYGMVLPGGLLGVGAGLARCRSYWPSIVCGAMALALGLLTEWHFFPFRANASLSYFVKHANQLSTVKLLMIGAGTFIGFWVPFRRVDSRR